MALNRILRSLMLGSAAIALSIAVAVPAGAANNTAGAPRSVHATAGDRSATISWKAPLSDGGAPILYYVVKAHPSNLLCQSKTLTCTFHGLKGKKYTFTVDAITKNGDGSLSGQSNFVKPKVPSPTTTTTQPPM